MKLLVTVGLYLGLVLMLGLILAAMTPAEEACRPEPRDDEL